MSRSRTLRVILILTCCVLSLALSRSASAGAFVVRFQDQDGFFIVDQASGLMSFHGTTQTFAQLCAGGGLTFEEVNIQLVATPAGPLHLLFSSPDHPVVIYPIAALPDPNHVGLGDCPILSGIQPIATGRARFQRTDNDYIGTGPGANAFGWTCSGTLTNAATGAPMQYSETFRAVATPGTVTQPRDVRTSIRLVP